MFVFQCLLLCLCWFFPVSLSHFSPSTIYWITLEQKINDFVYIACIYFCQDTVGGQKTVYKGMKVKKLFGRLRLLISRCLLCNNMHVVR